MSRRKQAKPRSLKPGDDEWDEVETGDQVQEGPTPLEEEMAPLSPSQDEDNRDRDEDDIREEDDAEDDKEDVNEEYEDTTLPDDINGPNDTLDSLESEGVGTTPGSSWRSSTPEGGSRSPGSTASERELSFTLGATEHTPYQCQFCDKAFPRLSYLKKHEQTHSDQMPFRCEFCSRLFKHKRSRDRHVKLHTGDRKYRCVHCEAAFSRSDHLKIHMKTHDNQKPFQCTVCNRGYNTAAALTSHMQNHKRGDGSVGVNPLSSRSSGGYKCLQCGDRFRRPDMLQSHIVVAHPGDNPSEGSPRASATLTPPSPRARHPQHHFTPKLACIYCTRDSFTTMDQLQTHVRAMHGAIISGELPQSPAQNGIPPPSPSPALPYPCDMCTMRFPTPVALVQHAAMAHAKRSPGSSPLACMACSIPFDSPAALAEHFLLVHGEQLRPTDLSKKGTKRPRSRDDALNAGTLLCNQCGAALPDFESFRIHVRAHLDGGSSVTPGVPERSPLICPQCGARFSSTSALERHAAAHLLALGSEFGCPSCSRAFTKPDELQKHLMDLHAHHIYRCAICKEMFDSKVAIQVHFAVKHSHECKVYRCTACSSPPASFRTEAEFALHVRSQHSQQQHISTPTALRCLFCRATCSSDLEMQFHLAAHADHFRCPICRESFQVEFLLDRHMQTHHAPQTINGSSPKPKQTLPGRLKMMPSENNNAKKEGNNCDICDRSDFQSESELAAHRKLVHHIKTGGKNGAVSLSCAYCSENCKSRTELENHMKSHSQGSATGGKHKCLICDEVFPSAAILAEHKLTHCKVVAGNNCTHCKSVLSNEEQFFAHLAQHSNNNNPPSSPNATSPVALPTPCVICRQTLVTDLEARIHARFHLKNSGAVSENFQCALCLKSFELQDVIPTGSELNNGIPTTHVCRNCYRQHSGIAQSVDLRCNECHLKFESNSALEVHMDTVHRKTYSCIECQAAFESEEEVRVHVQGHLAGGGSLECRLCRRSLASPLQLQAHLIEHTFAGCGGFTCYLCSAVFTAAAALQQHMLAHGLASRPYDCARCGLKFFFRAELDNHSYTHLEDDARLKLSAAESLKHPYFISQNGFHAMDAMSYFTTSPPNMKKIKTSQSPSLNMQTHSRRSSSTKEDVAVKQEEVAIKQEVEDKADEYIEVASPPPNPSTTPPSASPAVVPNDPDPEKKQVEESSVSETNGDAALLSPKKEVLEN